MIIQDTESIRIIYEMAQKEELQIKQFVNLQPENSYHKKRLVRIQNIKNGALFHLQKTEQQ